MWGRSPVPAQDGFCFLSEILPNLYGVPLENEFYELINEYSKVYFIVNQETEDDYMDILAGKILKADCRDYVFYGAYAEKWNDLLEKKDSILDPQQEKEPIESCGWLELPNFANDILTGVRRNKEDHRNLYLVYDDEERYREVKRILIKSCSGAA